ncbi:reverse transcriptase-like protein [Arthrobacter agilis]|uniref:reverse transcriptase-like protein n=1 Tax=Arthrobacter agilis TaxID=37921 RepID=UPI00361AF96F
MTDQQLFDPHASDRTAGPGADGAPQRLIVEADGGSRGNPGHAGYGALVRDPDTGRILVEKAAYIGKASNNVAEYSGLVSGLELAREINPEASVHVKMDSKLVVEQMSGRWQIKHADMRVLAGKARTVMNPRQVTYEWIPRERNKDADRLSNEAMDAGMAGVPWKPRAAEKEAVPVAAPAETPRPAGQLHHVEVWTADLPSAVSSLGWLLERLGFPRRKSGSTASATVPRRSTSCWRAALMSREASMSGGGRASTTWPSVPGPAPTSISLPAGRSATAGA